MSYFGSTSVVIFNVKTKQVVNTIERINSAKAQHVTISKVMEFLFEPSCDGEYPNTPHNAEPNRGEPNRV